MESKFVQYKHHGKQVTVLRILKGNHQEACLCYQGCPYFKPGKANNCEIAAAVYQNCVTFGIVTPVWECPKFTE